MTESEAITLQKHAQRATTNVFLILLYVITNIFVF